MKKASHTKNYSIALKLKEHKSHRMLWNHIFVANYFLKSKGVVNIKFKQIKYSDKEKPGRILTVPHIKKNKAGQYNSYSAIII